MFFLPSGCYLLALKNYAIFILEHLTWANISNADVELPRKLSCLESVSPDQAQQQT